MAEIIPLKIVRPIEDKVSLVPAKAYDDYGTAELASCIDFNPFSFLHIINPAYINQQKIDITQRFKMVASKYQDFKRDNVLITDPQEAFYLYRIQENHHNFVGLIAGASINEYQNNKIKIHENTLDYRVYALKEYFQTAGFNTEPVLLIHKHNKRLAQWMEDYMLNTPYLYHFSTTDRQTHTVWKISNKEDILFVVKAFEKFENLYIADGHHRCEASNWLKKQNPEDEVLNYFPSYIISENNVKINEYNRVIHDLNGYSEEEFINALKEDFSIQKIEKKLWKPSKKHEFGMYLNGKYYKLKLINPPKTESVLENIDAQILYLKILSKILGINDLRTDSRIDYIAGNRDISEMFQKIDKGEYKVGFTLMPPTIEEIKHFANNQMIMPPKSTYIEPKLRSGLFIYQF